jgi:4-hydroxybenzoate polyprenyltransferase
VRARHTFQVVGIVAVFSLTTHGFSSQSLYAVVAAFFLSVATFFFDDAHDVESDRVVHPERSISKGEVSARTAYLLGATSLFAAVLLASMLQIQQFVIFIVVSITAIGIVFLNLGSVTRAFLTAFVIWALFPFSAFPEARIMLFGLMISLPHIGGSIAKDFLHSAGDASLGLKPPPHWARYVASIAFFLGSAVVGFPFFLGFTGWLYLPFILPTMITCLLLGVDAAKGEYRRIYIYGRIGMISTLLAIIVGLGQG